MEATEFAKTHKCDADWLMLMSNRTAVFLKPGQRGTYAGFHATVRRHCINGMYEVEVPGGIACIDGGDFVAA